VTFITKRKLKVFLGAFALVLPRGPELVLPNRIWKLEALNKDDTYNDYGLRGPN
jgi:hypothetical protein